MVLFITGLCRRTCWYCPLSRERKGSDQVYANEHRIESPDDAIMVARGMRALGTGITGGEPLERLERVVAYATRLKQEFGPSFHIHLYTGHAPCDAELAALAGIVDEIRMHPPAECWEDIASGPYIRSIQVARQMGFEAGMEVPALPDLHHLIPALPFLDFLNINELEWGETNAPEMRSRSLVLKDSVHNAVQGARAWSTAVCSHEKVHFCSSAFKDSVQLRKRLLRTARNTARPFDEISDEGTIIYGRMEGITTLPEMIRGIPQDLFEFRDGGLELAWWVLYEQGERMPGDKSIIERYPGRGIIVEVTPL